MKKFCHLISTLFFIGKSPIAPGTLGALATVALLWYYPVDNIWMFLGIALFITLAGVPVSTITERYLGKEDPGEVIIDEVAGQMIALILVPHQLKYYIIAFVLFRLFDILKPPPVSTADKFMKEGWGIMFDDVFAGIYALLVIHTYIRFIEPMFI